MLTLSKARGASRDEQRRASRVRSESTATTIALSRKSRGLSMAAGTPGSTIPDMSQWLSILKRFNDTNKVMCKALEEEMDEPRCMIEFPTGSHYDGPWNVRGMTGYGRYHFPDSDVTYEGNFEDGQCHGEGALKYHKKGVTLHCTCDKGLVVERKLVFVDGLEHAEDQWRYCHAPDRRFTIEYDEGMEPAGRSYQTAEQPTREIPPGHFDTGDGFYEPVTRTVYKYNDLPAIVRYPCEDEQKWIKDNCRRSPLMPIGGCPFFYEKWMLPTLELEQPPPHSARTKNTIDDEPEFFDDEDEDRHWFRIRFSRASRASRSASRASRTSAVSNWRQGSFFFGTC